MTVRRELDFNRDQQAVGVANLLAALVCLAAWLGGAKLLGAIPFAVTGGLLVFLRVSLLANWLLDRSRYLSPLENAVLLAILLVTMLSGWLAALMAGLVLALLLFVIDYSRISAVRSLITGRTRRSHVDRSPARSRLLDRYGDSILVICLQGHLFFGTAHIRRRTIMERLAQICESAGIELVFSGLSNDTRRLLLRSGILAGDREGHDWFSDLDHGLEFCENELLPFTLRR